MIFRGSIAVSTRDECTAEILHKCLWWSPRKKEGLGGVAADVVGWIPSEFL
jgi:hypothetical protein